MKTCKKCGERKTLTEFHKHRLTTDGRDGRCRVCKSIERKAQYEKNRERENACHKERWANNREHESARQKAWREKNREHDSARKKAWCEENRERVAAKSASRRASKKQAELQWTTEAQKDAIDAKYALRDVYTKEKGEEYHVDHIWPIKGYPTVFEDFDERNIDFELLREDMLLLWENSFRGLHLAHNLEVIPASENLSKSNKRPVDKDGNERPACKWSKTEYDY